MLLLGNNFVFVLFDVPCCFVLSRALQLEFELKFNTFLFIPSICIFANRKLLIFHQFVSYALPYIHTYRKRNIQLFKIDNSVSQTYNRKVKNKKSQRQLQTTRKHKSNIHREMLSKLYSVNFLIKANRKSNANAYELTERKKILPAATTL